LNRAPRISVVVPTVGRLATLRRVLDRLEAQTAPAGEFEVIVAADAKAAQLDELDRLLEGRSYQAQRLQGALPGASAARNAGWRAARAPLLLFIDDDILADPVLIEEHLLWHHRNPSREVGVLGHVRWAQELRVTPFMRWLEHGIQFNYPGIVGQETVWGNFYTANVSVKRALVESAGGFDERRLPYGYEDLDLALRMHRRGGFRLLYNRAASAEHVHPMDLDFWKQRVARIALSERRFVEMHPEIPAYFYDLFAAAAARPRVAPYGDRLARFVPRRLPLVGPYVWSRADIFYRQALAGPFLEAWQAARHDETADGPQSEESSTPASSGGSPPGGPK
jgi:glycosyltransferase involved in cell wall biosynthesis